MGCDSATGKVSGRLQHHMWDEGGNLIPEADVFHFTKNNFVVNYVVDTLVSSGSPVWHFLGYLISVFFRESVRMTLEILMII